MDDMEAAKKAMIGLIGDMPEDLLDWVDRFTCLAGKRGEPLMKLQEADTTYVIAPELDTKEIAMLLHKVNGLEKTSVLRVPMTCCIPHMMNEIYAKSFAHYRTLQSIAANMDAPRHRSPWQYDA